MSSWLDIKARIKTPLRKGVEEVLSTVPTGSEDGPDVLHVDSDHWVVAGSMRDMGEENVPELRDWFCSVVGQLRAREAEMMVEGWQFTYVYDLDGGNLKLRPRMWSE